MLFSMEQSILAEETLANLWSFAKSANVSTFQTFPSYGITILSYYTMHQVVNACSKIKVTAHHMPHKLSVLKLQQLSLIYGY